MINRSKIKKQIIRPGEIKIKNQHAFKKVMGEYKSGKLKTSSGKKVTNRKQAIAIALHKARKK